MSELSIQPLVEPEICAIPRPEIAFGLQRVMEAFPNRGTTLTLEQTDACLAIGHALLAGVPSGYVEMATGTGKTVIESALAEAAVNAGKRVLLLAPTKSIAEQLHGNDTTRSTGLGRFTNLLELASVRPHFGSRRANKKAPVVISTYQGFVQDFKNGHAKLGEFDVVIADECHRSLGAATSEALQSAYPHAFKVGFSATPDYAVDRQSDEVYDRSLFEFSLRDAIESGRTAPIKSLIYATSNTLRLVDKRAEFTEKELAPLISSLERNATALELTRAFVADGRQGIIACIPGDKNYHARWMAEQLNGRGIRTRDVGAHLSDEDVALRLRQFAAGELDVLTFTRSLEEGWDCDRASFALNLAPTTSPVRTKQLMGRILRRNPDGKESVFVDFVDEIQGVRKSQYTAMHALGLEEIDFTRTLGRSTTASGNSWVQQPLKPLEHVSPELLKRLQSLQGKLLNTVTIKPVEDPLVKHWNDLLAKEGLPTELESNDVLPAALSKRVEQAYQRFVYENGAEPTSIADLFDLLGKLTTEQAKVIGEYGLRALFRAGTRESMVEPVTDDNTRLIVDGIDIDQAFADVFDTLSEREAGVLTMKYGLLGTKTSTLDQIGDTYGVTRERIRQIASKAESKLHFPARADYLRPWYYGESCEATGAESTYRRGTQRTVDARYLKFLNDLLNWRHEHHYWYEFGAEGTISPADYITEALDGNSITQSERGRLGDFILGLATREDKAKVKLTRGESRRLYYGDFYRQIFSILD